MDSRHVTKVSASATRWCQYVTPGLTVGLGILLKQYFYKAKYSFFHSWNYLTFWAVFLLPENDFSFLKFLLSFHLSLPNFSLSWWASILLLLTKVCGLHYNSLLLFPTLGRGLDKSMMIEIRIEFSHRII